MPLQLPTSDADAVCLGSGTRPLALLPGSFNPVHAGHWGLAAAAERQLHAPLAFELSVQNVDKPALTPDEVHLRASQFAGKADLWMTRAPTFVRKARLFPGTTFVVGVDTAARIFDPRYYLGRETRHHALETFRDLQCRFLVAARVDPSGRLMTLADLPVPDAWRGLFDAIDVRDFRLDVSSTQLRGG